MKINGQWRWLQRWPWAGLQTDGTRWWTRWWTWDERRRSQLAEKRKETEGKNSKRQQQRQTGELRFQLVNYQYGAPSHNNTEFLEILQLVYRSGATISCRPAKKFSNKFYFRKTILNHPIHPIFPEIWKYFALMTWTWFDTNFLRLTLKEYFPLFLSFFFKWVYTLVRPNPFVFHHYVGTFGCGIRREWHQSFYADPLHHR